MTLAIGSKAPDVEGKLQDGTTWRSRDHLGSPLVVYFYPKDFTPGCTKEACAFRDAREELVGLHGAEIVGVSRDSHESHAKFAKQHSLPFPLVADPKGEITKAFDAQLFMGILPLSKRVTYVIDGDGVVRGVFDHNAAAERHVEEVRDCLAGLTKQS